MNLLFLSEIAQVWSKISPAEEIGKIPLPQFSSSTDYFKYLDEVISTRIDEYINNPFAQATSPA